jgi:hypothetical protein
MLLVTVARRIRISFESVGHPLSGSMTRGTDAARAGTPKRSFGPITNIHADGTRRLSNGWLVVASFTVIIQLSGYSTSGQFKEVVWQWPFAEQFKSNLNSIPIYKVYRTYVGTIYKVNCLSSFLKQLAGLFSAKR